MSPTLFHTSYPADVDVARARPIPNRLASDGPAVWRRELAAADRACCCPARPAVIALLPPSPTRGHTTDLLLCRHHLRALRGSLIAAGAAILDPENGPEPTAAQRARYEAAERAAARSRHPSSQPKF